MDAPIAVVLAAGKGTRMKSDLPKVLCEANGRPLVGYVIDALRSAGVEGLVAVVGYQAELVQEKLSSVGNIQFALQAEQLGTCLLYTSPSPRDQRGSRMPSSA